MFPLCARAATIASSAISAMAVRVRELISWGLQAKAIAHITLKMDPPSNQQDNSYLSPNLGLFLKKDAVQSAQLEKAEGFAK